MVQRLAYRKVQRLKKARLEQRRRALQRELAQLHAERLGDYSSWYNQHPGTNALTRASSHYSDQLKGEMRAGRVSERQIDRVERLIDGMDSLNSRDRDWIYNRVVLDEVIRQRTITKALRENASAPTPRSK